jgi:MOSC domain-containing protein YiiM
MQHSGNTDQVEHLHLACAELEAGIDEIRSAPIDNGVVELLVSRPAVGERTVLDEGTLDLTDGLVGDTWRTRGSSSTHDGRAHPDRQLTLMNARAVALFARTKERWPLAGDQIYVDFDLSGENLPAGTRVALGTAVVEVTAEPHTGCAKFSKRFGVDALRFVNSPVGRELNLRGINARVVEAGTVRPGDAVRKVS